MASFWPSSSQTKVPVLLESGEWRPEPTYKLKAPSFFSTLMQTFLKKRNPHNLKISSKYLLLLQEKRHWLAANFKPSLPSNETKQYVIGQHTRKGGLKIISALSLDFFIYASGITTVNVHFKWFYVNE